MREASPRFNVRSASHNARLSDVGLLQPALGGTVSGVLIPHPLPPAYRVRVSDVHCSASISRSCTHTSLGRRGTADGEAGNRYRRTLTY